MRSKSKFKSVLLHIAGLFLCTGPLLAAILTYFPLWRDAGGGRIISGGALLLVILAWSPIYRFLKRAFASPAAYTLWLVLFILFSVLSKIAHEMTVISFVGFVGNALGALCFKFAGHTAEASEEANEKRS